MTSFFDRPRFILRSLWLAMLASLVFGSPARAAKVLIIGDLQYAMVADVAATIQLSLRSQSKEYQTSQVRGKIADVVEREAAQVVVALGSDAVGEALRLPPSVPVIYGLVVAPPRNSRKKLSGVYMSPPAGEYLGILRRYLPSLARMAVVGGPAMIKSLAADVPNGTTHVVTSPADVVNTVTRLNDARSLLLLPEADLLTPPVMSSVLLYSFKKGVPLLGISETHVKQGALMALVFDHKAVSRQIADKVHAALDGSDPDDLQDSPPRRYNLYLNSGTARKLGITIPDELAGRAKRTY